MPVKRKFPCSELQSRDYQNINFPKKVRTFQKWSLQENNSYLEFLNDAYYKLGSEFDRRSNKVFALMSSSYVKSRTPEQCRTHHQKMILGCGSLEKIILKLKAKESSKREHKVLKKRGRKPRAKKIEDKIESSKEAVNETENDPQQDQLVRSLIKEEIPICLLPEQSEQEWMCVLNF